MQFWQGVIFDNGLGGLHMFCHPFSSNKIQCGFVFNLLIFVRLNRLVVGSLDESARKRIKPKHESMPSSN